ncbi:hypothetical protein PtrCC142_010672 [Pyrenophora tritici-repentis]|nr:hypothetical protein PtrCC142_010672 [Pyrenophora tritici-repentis]
MELLLAVPKLELEVQPLVLEVQTLVLLMQLAKKLARAKTTELLLVVPKLEPKLELAVPTLLEALLMQLAKGLERARTTGLLLVPVPKLAPPLGEMLEALPTLALLMQLARELVRARTMELELEPVLVQKVVPPLEALLEEMLEALLTLVQLTVELQQPVVHKVEWERVEPRMQMLELRMPALPPLDTHRYYQPCKARVCPLISTRANYKHLSIITYLNKPRLYGRAPLSIGSPGLVGKILDLKIEIEIEVLLQEVYFYEVELLEHLETLWWKYSICFFVVP